MICFSAVIFHLHPVVKNDFEANQCQIINAFSMEGCFFFFFFHSAIMQCMESHKCFHVSHWYLWFSSLFHWIPPIRETLWGTWAEMEQKTGLGGFTSGSLPHYLNRLHLKKEKVIQVELGQLYSDLRHIYLLIISRCF